MGKEFKDGKVPLISKLGSHSTKNGYLFVAIIYGCIFAACHFFCFAKTKETVTTPEKEKISIKVQLKAVMQNRPYILALIGQVLFGFTLYGRTASVFALLTGISMLSLYFFNVKESAVIFYALAGATQFFFSGFNTAIVLFFYRLNKKRYNEIAEELKNGKRGQC